MRNYKSIFSLCAVVICSFIISMNSCNNSDDSKIEKLVEEVNSQCPAFYGIGTATNFKKEGKTVVIEYSVSDNISLYENSSDDAIYDIWRLFCIDEASDVDKEMIRIITSAGYGIKCVFNSADSQKKKILEVSNDKLKNYKALTQEEILKTFITIDKNNLPQTIDSKTQIVDLKIEKDNLIYIYEIDESNFDISEIENSTLHKESGIRNMREQFQNNTLTGYLYKIVCLSGRGICHRYIGNKTGKVVDIQFSNTEIRQIANANGVN